jgi:hypothetical protein
MNSIKFHFENEKINHKFVQKNNYIIQFNEQVYIFGS